MPDGGEELNPLAVGAMEECLARARKMEKDPRKIARKYQLELCKKAMEENVIVYLGTGCGKTHIAVLLMYEFGNEIRNPRKSICVFLAPTVALVQQQARVIEESVDFKVGICRGNFKRLKSHEYWEKEMKQYEVLVMTPDILLHCLFHCFVKMDSIALLIFDECHHAQVQSNHPYAEIMRGFYKKDVGKFPRIFGMTASPVIGKGASSEGNLAKSINSLEELLDAKDKGIIAKSRSLEKVLESSCKKEAKLIGYDEIPIDMAPPPDSTGFENLTIEEPVISKFIPKVCSTNELMNGSLCKTSTKRQSPSNGQTSKTDESDSDSQTTGGLQKETSTARSRLYQVCTANCWKPPSFECCKEEGPGHLKLFTYRVLVEMEEAPDMVLECFSGEHPKKKAAAEHAAEAALWFLEKQGYS
ncbi:DNA helicase, ATP-dependent [Parasponia andersonii]|uniref:DNA helicase, ATP-dependent n=1 Tax=Parasponia andersonii TaxID=3476 RepID=A0A2P5D1A4_PARAD|nr:DNA helicase, ATP-dependent [Parasponia andersonii]